MRKMLCLFASVIAATVACSKQDASPAEEVEVTFNLGVVSGPITRAGNEGVYESISSTAPSGPFSLSAQSVENSLRSYDITTGVPLSMAVGGYDVTGAWKGRALSQIYRGVLYSEPTWSASKTVTISESGAELSIPAAWTCPALVFDLSEVSKVVFRGASGEVTLTSFPGTEDYGVVYPKPDGAWGLGDYYLTVTVYPTDEIYGEPRIYKVETSSPDLDYTYVQNGYWYLLSPGKVEVVSGSMGLMFPEWSEGVL